MQPSILLSLFLSLPAQGQEGGAVNTDCPVMPGNEALPVYETSYEGRLILFCCDRCVYKFQADPSAYLANLPVLPPKNPPGAVVPSENWIRLALCHRSCCMRQGSVWFFSSASRRSTETIGRVSFPLPSRRSAAESTCAGCMGSAWIPSVLRPKRRNDSIEGRVYLCERQFLGWGRYVTRFREGRLQQDSDVWMTASYWTPLMVGNRLRDEEWLGTDPIPEIPDRQARR